MEIEGRRFEEYLPFIDEETKERIVSVAIKLEGLKLTHVNATSFGGGVAEILRSLIPLMNSVGLKCEWEVIEAPNDFFNVTKKFHNTLQGADVEISQEEWELYEKVVEENVRKLKLAGDFIVIHDPQPAAIPIYHNNGKRWIWRCHIDLSTPNESIWKRFSKYLRSYEKYIFHLEEYFQSDLRGRSVAFPPSIDPLSDKNRELSEKEIKSVLERFSIDPSRPIITVVARFDPWKDLKSAVDVFRKVKEEIKNAYLIIISAMAHDDPEGWILYEEVKKYVGRDPDIRILTNIDGVGNLEVNALQRVSTVALHTAIREGFGLVISEALWKGIPVVARPVGGVKLQVINDFNGYLEWNVNDLARKVVKLIQDPAKRRLFGERGRETVRKQFLITSHLERYLKLVEEMGRGKTSE